MAISIMPRDANCLMMHAPLVADEAADDGCGEQPNDDVEDRLLHSSIELLLGLRLPPSAMSAAPRNQTIVPHRLRCGTTTTEAIMRRFQAALFLGLICLGLTGCIFERDHGRGGYGDGRAYQDHDHDHYRR